MKEKQDLNYILLRIVQKNWLQILLFWKAMLVMQRIFESNQERLFKIAQLKFMAKKIQKSMRATLKMKGTPADSALTHAKM